MLDSEILYDWSIEKMVEIKLVKPDDFLKIKETLTRVGIASKKLNSLTQTCHIFHKRGKYYIIHFKEAFLLDGGTSNLTLEDVSRRNKIVELLIYWGMAKVVDPSMIVNTSTMDSIKVVPYREKKDWVLVEKFKVGKPRKNK